MRVILNWTLKVENVIVVIETTLQNYTMIAQEKLVADINAVRMDSAKGKVLAPVYLTPEEYIVYAKQKKIPER